MANMIKAIFLTGLLIFVFVAMSIMGTIIVPLLIAAFVAFAIYAILEDNDRNR